MRCTTENAGTLEDGDLFPTARLQLSISICHKPTSLCLTHSNKVFKNLVPFSWDMVNC
jgi:hypothetical protein